MKRIITSLIEGRSQSPEFIKRWSGAVVLTAEEAEQVRSVDMSHRLKASNDPGADFDVDANGDLIHANDCEACKALALLAGGRNPA